VTSLVRGGFAVGFRGARQLQFCPKLKKATF
jgi:hypothetical protein